MMKRSQLVALAAAKQFTLDGETEDFIRFIEGQMRKSLMKRILDYEDYLDKKGDDKGASVAYVCYVLLKDAVYVNFDSYMKQFDNLLNKD